MQVHVRHEGTLGELVRRQPAFARLQHARIAAQDWRYWRRNDGASHSHDLQVVFLGKSGYGKSSLVNALSGLPAMATSDVEACTRVAQSVEYAIRPGNFLSLADLPGLGESQQRDAEYLALYRQILAKADVVVYTLRADCRDYSIDQQAFARLFDCASQQRKVILALNGCDKIEPLQRRASVMPSHEQLQNIERKAADLRRLFPEMPRIVPCSAATGWNLDALSQEIARLLACSPGVAF
ncbi:GTPase family protein [Pseudomonas sp. AN-1]|uniref:GTPase family protein n=1 Tax=Pseudomonas sp. AN-1 TaxID=3096605 RepID=UPI002A6AF5CD|nr:GTPase [Pseudomonas sp. AN-1]WPP46946.1 GTPase [Pseudomonas sp. AN-1]